MPRKNETNKINRVVLWDFVWYMVQYSFIVMINMTAVIINKRKLEMQIDDTRWKSRESPFVRKNNPYYSSIAFNVSDVLSWSRSCWAGSGWLLLLVDKNNFIEQRKYG